MTFCTEPSISGAPALIVIVDGKSCGRTARNSCGTMNVSFSSVVLIVTLTLPWKVKIPVMSLRLERSSLGPDGGMPTPICSENSADRPTPT